MKRFLSVLFTILALVLILWPYIFHFSATIDMTEGRKWLTFWPYYLAGIGSLFLALIFSEPKRK